MRKDIRVRNNQTHYREMRVYRNGVCIGIIIILDCDKKLPQAFLVFELEKKKVQKYVESTV